jgi:hypothetical protein
MGERRTMKPGRLAELCNPLNHNGMSDHGGDFSTTGKKRKTYGRFLGMIFLGGSWPTLIVERQRLAREEIPKNRKNTKKSAKYFSPAPRF